MAEHLHDPNLRPHRSRQDESREALERAIALRHEPMAVSVRGVLFWGGALVLLMVGTMALMYGLVLLFTDFGLARSEPESPVEIAARPRPPGPVVEANQSYGTIEQQEALRKTLDSYGWINPQAGIARIPIDRAMRLYADRQVRPEKTRAEQDQRAE